MRARALIIGINIYPAAASQIELKGAVDDAIDFAQWALDPAGGGVAQADLHFWTYPAKPMPAGLEYLGQPDRPWPAVAAPPNFEVVPHARDITHAAASLASAAAQNVEDTEEHERLYVFLAGHGATLKLTDYNSDPQNCFLAGDYIPNDPTGLLPLDKLRIMLEHRGPQESILIHDCCRSNLPLNVPNPVLSTDFLNPTELNSFWLIGRAAKYGELAFEVPHDKPVRGAFTKILVQALRQYRVRNELTIGQLRGFVEKGVALEVKPSEQVPSLLTKEGTQDFSLLQGAPTGEPPAVHIRPPAGGGEIRILDGEAQMVEDDDLQNPIPLNGEDVIVVRLMPGSYIFEHDPSGEEQPHFHFGPEPTYVSF